MTLFWIDFMYLKIMLEQIPIPTLQYFQTDTVNGK